MKGRRRPSLLGMRIIHPSALFFSRGVDSRRLCFSLRLVSFPSPEMLDLLALCGGEHSTWPGSPFS